MRFIASYFPSISPGVSLRTWLMGPDDAGSTFTRTCYHESEVFSRRTSTGMQCTEDDNSLLGGYSYGHPE